MDVIGNYVFRGKKKKTILSVFLVNIAYFLSRSQYSCTGQAKQQLKGAQNQQGWRERKVVLALAWGWGWGEERGWGWGDRREGARLEKTKCIGAFLPAPPPSRPVQWTLLPTPQRGDTDLQVFLRRPPHDNTDRAIQEELSFSSTSRSLSRPSPSKSWVRVPQRSYLQGGLADWRNGGFGESVSDDVLKREDVAGGARGQAGFPHGFDDDRRLLGFREAVAGVA